MATHAVRRVGAVRITARVCATPAVVRVVLPHVCAMLPGVYDVSPVCMPPCRDANDTTSVGIVPPAFRLDEGGATGVQLALPECETFRQVVRDTTKIYGTSNLT